MIDILLLLAAVLIDYRIGDPLGWPHPIIFIGKMIKSYETLIRALKMDHRFGGALLWLLCIVTVIGLLTLILESAKEVNIYLYRAITLYFLFASMAATSLKTEVTKVATALSQGNLQEGRKYLSWLVGRDTAELSEDEVIKGAIETGAENTIDGVLAPLFYIIVGWIIGYPVQLVFLYKTVNTLDSMVGYIQEPYTRVGYISAKIDDVFNLIPARLGSALMLLGGGILGMDLYNGKKVWLRDRLNHKSPNAGYPESAMAGLLDIQLGGTHTYFGEVLEKPTIGDAIRDARVQDIYDTCRVMYMSEFILLMMGIVVLLLLK